MTDRVDKMRMELRRGVLVMAVLAALREEQYGYSLRKKLIAADIDIEEGTLYPLVRRLESYELLTSEWREDEGRKKRYYRISEHGEFILNTLSRDWYAINKALQVLLEEEI
ncbi:MAG: PadR family transcriptional regulator [Deltaproteobacteria bacterium]|nr:PadR family transcriptional regulator [Deltaproteobacteria bacterium]